MEISEIFTSEDFTMRTLKIGENLYFRGGDVARCLGFRKPANAVLTYVAEKHKIRKGIPGSGMPPTVYISQPAMFKFVLQSRMPAAEKFCDWVTEDVLGSIFKTGKYELPDFERFKAIADSVDRNTPNFEEIKKICIDTNHKLKDDDKVKRGRNGGLQAQQNIRNMKKEFKQTKIDLAMFQLKDKLVSHAIDKISSR